MICPYCGIGISANWDEWDEDCYPVPSEEDDYDEGYNIASGFCPDCQRFIVRLQHGNGYTNSQYGAELQEIDNEVLIYPKFLINKQIDTYVPKRYETLFQEALKVGLNVIDETRRRFKNHNYYEDSEQYETKRNIFYIPENFIEDYCVAITCESVQLILEVC